MKLSGASMQIRGKKPRRGASMQKIKSPLAPLSLLLGVGYFICMQCTLRDQRHMSRVSHV